MPNKRSNKNNKQRNVQQPSKAMQVFGGSMSLARNPAREKTKTVTRQFLCKTASTKISATVLSEVNSPYILGSQYVSDVITFALRDLTPEAISWVQKYDMYRFSKAELFVTSYVEAKTNTTKATAPITHYCFVDPDSSESQLGDTTTWHQICQRDNLARVVLRANNPSVRLATWTPRPLFSAVSGDSPSNMIGNKSTWMDALITTQEHSGVRCFAACPVESATNDQYRFHLQYEVRVTVQCKAPL